MTKTARAFSVPWFQSCGGASRQFDRMIFQEENSGYYREISSSYVGLRLKGRIGKVLSIKVTPVSGLYYGRTSRIDITPSPRENKFTGKELEDGVQEVDCALESGDYKVVEVEKSTVVLNNAGNSSVYFARSNIDDTRKLYSNRIVLSPSNPDRIVNNERCEDSESMEEADSVKEKAVFTAKKVEGLCDSPLEFFEEEEIISGGASGSAGGTEMISRIHAESQVDGTSVVYPDEGVRAASGKADYNNYTTEKTAYLQYKSADCYVWAVEGYFTQSGRSESGKVTREICEKIGKTFDEISRLERNIFGQEYDRLKSRDGWLPMDENCETGTVVNLLLYDIAGDYVEGGTLGVYGFFTNGDYYVKDTRYNIASKSNGGKFLHIDSGFASNESTLPTIISTVVHEFQHMIYYGQKKSYELADSGYSNVSFNEMCSMLAEDMFQEKLQLDDKNSAKERFSTLRNSWAYVPLFNWSTEKKYGNFNYSNAFGIGSFVSKKYGGADFVYDYMHTSENIYGGFDSFLEAINMHDSSVTKETLLRDFCVELCTGRTFNTDVHSKKHGLEGYYYPMTKFDFKNMKVVSNGTTYVGPAYTTLFGALEIFEPNKIDVAKICDTKTDREELRVLGSSEDNIKEYVIVVKK